MQPVSDLDRTPADRHLRPKAGAEYLGIGLSTFFKYAKSDPYFPRGIKLSTRCTVYRQSELDAYLRFRANLAAA